MARRIEARSLCIGAHAFTGAGQAKKNPGPHCCRPGRNYPRATRRYRPRDRRAPAGVAEQASCGSPLVVDERDHVQRGRQLAQRREPRIRNLVPRELREPRMTHAGGFGDARPLPAPLFQPRAQVRVETEDRRHAASIAKFCGERKQHFALRRSKTARMADTSPRRPANIVLGEALAHFMAAGHWSNVTLARASGVSEGTIRNYLAPHKRDQGASGKAPSAKLAELDKIAEAMGLRVTDLLEDMSSDDRALLHRRRAAEWYQRTGVLPPWAPEAAPRATPPEPTTAGGLPVPFVERRVAPPQPAPNVTHRRGVRVITHPQADDPDVFPPPRPGPHPRLGVPPPPRNATGSRGSKGSKK